jgi:hypothetical protein
MLGMSQQLPGSNQIARLAAELNAADENLRKHPGDSEYQQLSRMARERLYSPAWEANVSALQPGDTAAVGPSIDFLDADPICFRSAYAKERLCRFLSRVELTQAQRTRLNPIVTRALASQRPMKEQKQWRQLARAVGVSIPDS